MKRQLFAGHSPLMRLVQGVATSVDSKIVVKKCYDSEHFDVAASMPETELLRTAEDSFLRYRAYQSRPFIVSQGREIVTALHSKAIIAPPEGLVDEFNVGGGTGMPAYLLEQDFERHAGALHVTASKVKQQRGLSIPLCHYGIGTFGHFVLDALLQVYIFRRELAEEALLLHWPLPEIWMEQVLDRIVGGRRREITASIVRMERAGLSSALAGHGVYFPGSWSIRFFEWLRACMQVPEYSSNGRLYIRRAPRFGRLIANSEDLERLTHSYGFTAISPEDHALDDQMRLFASAGVVLSVWGSTLTLAPMLGRDRIVIELLPLYVRDAWFPRQAAVHGLDYRPLLQEADAAGTVTIDLEALEISLRALPA